VVKNAAAATTKCLASFFKRSQRPAVVTGEPLAQVFDEVFFAHGWRVVMGGDGFEWMDRSPCGLHPGLVTVPAVVAPF
jgi:hypothetical protein